MDFYDPSSGAQLHDISPANGENITDPDPVFHLPGLFWLVQINADQFQDTSAGLDGSQRTLRITNQLEFDRFQIMGPGNVRSHLTMNTVYKRSGTPTTIVPQNHDPLSPYNWAGTIWTASASSTFHVSYDDGSWSAKGTVDSARATEGTPGHMGHEENGYFATH